MKSDKKIINILGIITAAVLSIILVILLVALPMVSAATSFFKAKNIHKVIADIDYSQIITSEMGVGEGEIPALGNDLMNELMKTEMMKEIVEIYVDNIFEVMEGESEDTGFTADEIMAIANRHIDELAEILKAYIGTSIPLTDKTLKEMTRLVAKEYSATIAEMIPTAEDLGLDSEVLNIIMKLRNGTYFGIVLGVAIGLTLAVMLCQVMKFKGFMWIGIDYLLAAVLSLTASFIVKGLDLTTLLGDGSIGVKFLSSMTGFALTEMQKGAGILALLGIIFVGVFVFGRKFLKKKNIVVQSKAVNA